MVRALVYIQEHLDDALEREEVARVAAFSRFYFHRIFRALAGETLNEHVRRLWLERAARSSKHFDGPVTQIALQAGFETPNPSRGHLEKCLDKLLPQAKRSAFPSGTVMPRWPDSFQLTLSAL